MPSHDTIKKLPEKVSGPLYSFLEDDIRVFNFLETNKSFLNAWRLLPWPSDSETKNLPPAKPIFESKEDLEGYTGLLSENLYITGVNSFLVYLSDILGLVFKAHPIVLKSSETITVDEIFSFQSLMELYEYLAERKINELSFSGFRSISQFFKKRLGVQIFSSLDDETKCKKVIETRNLITHHRGKVNQRFIARGGKSYKLGEQVRISHDDLIESLDFLAETAFRLDTQLVAKYSLPSRSVRLFIDNEEIEIDESLRKDGFRRIGSSIGLKFPGTPKKEKL